MPELARHRAECAIEGTHSEGVRRPRGRATRRDRHLSDGNRSRRRSKATSRSGRRARLDRGVRQCPDRRDGSPPLRSPETHPSPAEASSSASTVASARPLSAWSRETNSAGSHRDRRRGVARRDRRSRRCSTGRAPPAATGPGRRVPRRSQRPFPGFRLGCPVRDPNKFRMRFEPLRSLQC